MNISTTDIVKIKKIIYAKAREETGVSFLPPNLVVTSEILPTGVYRPLDGVIFVKDPSTIPDVGFFLSAIDHKDAPVEHMQKMATHALEDTIAHELGHHIFHTNYTKQINKECEEQDEVSFDPSHLTILDEAFARWFNEAVVGHEHISSPLI